jgi:hypothetical protein
MRARWTLNLFLLILAAGLGWAVLRDVREARETSRLTGMDPNRIEGVELTRPGRDTVRLERASGGGWRMTVPYLVAADPERVGRLLGVVQTGVARSFPAEGVDLERLGLEPDPVRISLGGQTLRFGGTEPIDRLRYVASGDLVHLTEDLYYHLLTAPASDYADPRPLPAGMVAASGDVNGEALDPATLAAIRAIKAERVEPMDGDLAGQILRIQPEGDGAALRFLVSPDGLRWSRPDLHLTYLVASPPPALVDQDAAVAAGAQAEPEGQARAQAAGPLPEEVIGVVGGGGPGPADGQSGADTGEGAADDPTTTLSLPDSQDWGEAVVDPEAPLEMRIERLAPAGPSPDRQDQDPLEARQHQIDEAVAASFGGAPVRSQAQIQREEEGVVDGDAIVSPEDAAGPPPAVKLRPE